MLDLLNCFTSCHSFLSYPWTIPKPVCVLVQALLATLQAPSSWCQWICIHVPEDSILQQPRIRSIWMWEMHELITKTWKLSSCCACDSLISWRIEAHGFADTINLIRAGLKAMKITNERSYSIQPSSNWDSLNQNPIIHIGGYHGQGACCPLVRPSFWLLSSCLHFWFSCSQKQ